MGLIILNAFSSQSVRVIKSGNRDMGGDVSGMGDTRRVVGFVGSREDVVSA